MKQLGLGYKADGRLELHYRTKEEARLAFHILVGLNNTILAACPMWVDGKKLVITGFTPPKGKKRVSS
jgi:hypothetical protein